MSFKHQLLPRFELESEDTPKGRLYKSPIGDLKSVTTILNEKLDKTWLKNWEKKIGKEEADKIRNSATSRGNVLHDLLEKYLLNEEIDTKKIMPTNRHMFNQATPILDNNVTTLYGTEFPIWSRHLRTAGRIDVIGDWNGVGSIIDFKNSRREKTRADIEKVGYFYQTTAYSIALEEQTGMKMEQLVILVMVKHEGPRLFIADRKEYLNKTVELFRGIKL